MLCLRAREAANAEGSGCPPPRLLQIRDRSGLFLGGQASVVSARGGRGGAAVGGSGEMQIELERRRLNLQAQSAKRQLKKVARHRQLLRDGRRAPVVGLVGYTNAGKSALLNGE